MPTVNDWAPLLHPLNTVATVESSVTVYRVLSTLDPLQLRRARRDTRSEFAASPWHQALHRWMTEHAGAPLFHVDIHGARALAVGHRDFSVEL